MNTVFKIKNPKIILSFKNMPVVMAVVLIKFPIAGVVNDGY